MEVLETQLELASRAWAAEEENSRRLAVRRTLVLSALTAVAAALGLNASAITRTVRIVAGDWPGPAAAAATFALVCGGIAVWFLLGAGSHALEVTQRESHDAMASATLHLEDEEASVLFLAMEEFEARRVAYARVAEAARVLRDRNWALAVRLRMAQSWFLSGMFLLAIAGVAYALAAGLAD